MTSEKSPAPQNKQSSGTRVWKIIGGAALVIVATGVIASLHDIKRYIKMVRM